jgi:penicillin-insensitive murein DD-endopeptidase
MALKPLIFFTALALVACTSVNGKKAHDSKNVAVKDTTEVEKYQLLNANDDVISQSTGSVSNGTLKHGKLMPFEGINFRYFDTASYLNDRAFVNLKVLNSVLSTYEYLNEELPGRTFTIMECSHRNGGKLYPHRTHQNGLSIDFMMPLVKDNKPYYELDTMGQFHYLLDFDDAGRMTQDTSVHIDFELVAQHILALDSACVANNLSIKKVIINTDLKDELFEGPMGKQLQCSRVYVVKSLTPLINSLHDDHYHIDFEIQ